MLLFKVTVTAMLNESFIGFSIFYMQSKAPCYIKEKQTYIPCNLLETTVLF